MKKLYFLLLAASVLAGSANAQDTSIPDAFDCEEAYWVTSIEDEVNAVSPLLSVYRSFGDTVVDGEHWKKMHSCIMSATADIRTTRLYFNDLNYGNECVGLTRKDGDKVYGIVLTQTVLYIPHWNARQVRQKSYMILMHLIHSDRKPFAEWNANYSILLLARLLME